MSTKTRAQKTHSPKILITGGAGFLGLHLAKFFKQKKWQVSLLDIADYPSHEYDHQGFRLLRIDVRDKRKVDQAVAGNDVVIHTAAALPLWSRHDIMTTNVNGTINVATSALKHKVKRMIHISSTAVYGVPEKHPIVETDALIGVGAYGESKIAAEKKLRKLMKRGLNLTILRPKTFVGTERLGVFEILFDWVHDGKKIPVIGDGRNRYQLMDVDDLVTASYLIGQSRSRKLNDVFNIGAKQFGTVREDLEALFRHAHSGSRLLATPAWLVKGMLRGLETLHLSPLYQWVYDTADKDSFVSIEKLEKTLHWSPKYSNAAALIKSFDWYQAHYTEVKARGVGVSHTVGWKQGALALIKKVM